MEWWTSLWLNEGFARFMEHLAVDDIFPECNPDCMMCINVWLEFPMQILFSLLGDIWTQYIDTVYQDALSRDALESR